MQRSHAMNQAAETSTSGVPEYEQRLHRVAKYTALAGVVRMAIIAAQPNERESVSKSIEILVSNGVEQYGGYWLVMDRRGEQVRATCDDCQKLTHRLGSRKCDHVWAVRIYHVTAQA